MGRKSKKGLFVYADGSKDRPVNQEGLNIVKKFALDAPQATAADEDLVLRLISRFANEAWLVFKMASLPLHWRVTSEQSLDLDFLHSLEDLSDILTPWELKPLWIT